MNTAFFFIVFMVCFAIIFNSLLAVMVFNNNPKSATNRIFSLLSIIISIWLLTNYLGLDLSIIGGSLLWVRLTIFWATPMSFLFYLFSYTLPQNTLSMNRKLLSLMSFITGVVMIITLSPYAFTTVKIVNNSLQPVTGIGILPFTIVTTFYSIAAVYLLINKYLHSKGRDKDQFLYVMLGILIMLALIILTILIPAVVLKSVFFVQFIPIYTLIFLSMTTYAIIKHQLLDIRLLVAKSVGYLLILLVLGGFYSLYLIFVGSLIFKTSFTQFDLIFFGTIIAIVAFTLQPLRKILENITDKFFYKGYYSSEKLLKTLSDIMAVTIEIKLLTTSILNAMLHEMRITKGVFVLLKKDNQNAIDYIEGVGYEPLPTFTKEAIPFFFSNKEMVIFEDLEEGSMKDIMRKMSISIIAPLIIHDEKIGILCLGEKASGEIYSEQDINVIGILAPQLSVAIQNAKEYQEIKQFNVTLREEVDHATKDLKAANERLKSIDRLKDEFVSLASHELRTPMTAISSYIWMVKDDPNITDKQKIYLENTYKSTQRLIRLVNDMLNVSRIESGRLIIKPQLIDIEQVVQETITELLPKSQEQNITLTEEKSPTPLPKVFADPDKIKEVIMNLVGNSLKFTPSGGKITITFSENNGLVEVHISDNGRGIKKEDMPKLFQKFGMIEGNYLKTTPGQGTGLGLYISKSIIQLHGGSMWFQSDGENQGSTFSFSLKKA